MPNVSVHGKDDATLLCCWRHRKNNLFDFTKIQTRSADPVDYCSSSLPGRSRVQSNVEVSRIFNQAWERNLIQSALTIAGRMCGGTRHALGSSVPSAATIKSPALTECFRSFS